MDTAVVYKVTMTTTDNISEYIGCSAPQLKFRLANHDHTFRNPN